MIKSESEYLDMIGRLKMDEDYIATQKEFFKEQGLTSDQIEHAMQPLYSFRDQLSEEVEYYERIKRFDFEAIKNFDGLGRLLIALRIACGISQRELADRLAVSESQVSRDERNEYYNITVERANKVLRALGVVLNVKVNREQLSEIQSNDLVKA